ncbi:MAG TPA: hypothetical protein VJQ55_16810, partial [Candidatus Binatia bacterium]|nr:hypothetical protein [Candidatus Binatia bacterium]
GMIALFVFGPIGAVAGAFFGAWLGGRRGGTAPPAATPSHAEAAAETSPPANTRSDEIAPGTFGRNVAKSLGIVAVLAALGVGCFWLHTMSTATPWLNPNAANPVLQFEVRLPAGAALPGARDVTAELQTPHNRMPADMKPALYRRDGERAVVVGEVDLAFRTANRQIEVKVTGQPDRTFYLTLLDKAPHTNELGAWEARGDSDIRYRAKWPGKD